MIIPISDKFNEYSKLIFNMLNKHQIRVEIDERNEKMGAKIRNAEISKIPIMIILGEKELESEMISVRRKFEGNQGNMKIKSFIDSIVEEINNRKRATTFPGKPGPIFID